MKKIAILGASGSIGTSTLEVLRRHKVKFMLVAFSVYSHKELISDILDEFKDVYLVACKDVNEIQDLVKKYPHVTFVDKKEGLIKVATSNCDTLVSALVGFVGLEPTIKAIEQHKEIALANKETLVAAGEIVMAKAKENNVKIVPIDSEHSAIFQCLEKENTPKSIILTASGGPFFKNSLEELENVSLEQALNHPTWKMGSKITIDSASMFNKAFEIIEAYHLFGLKPEQIKVLIHPQSIVHSMVEFEDGSIKALLSVSDMKGPIAYALAYPTRLDDVMNPLSLDEVYQLEFYKADFERFKPLQLAYQALKEKGIYPTILNAANEEAVKLFLDKKIKFSDIYRIVCKTLANFKNDKDITLEKIYAADQSAREYVRRNYQ